MLKILWGRRSLITLFALNDVKLRYKNSILGFFWTFIEPLLMLTVLYFVFTNIIKSDIQHYALYLLLGLIIWYMFNRSTSMGLESFLYRSSIIKKVYFPREIVVISSCLTAFIMMMFEFAAFGVFLIVFQFVPPLTAVLFPLLIIDLFILCVGISLLLSTLNVFFRDVRFIWGVVLQVGFFLSPIIYTIDIFPESFQFILKFNPLVPILDTAHNLVIYGILPSVNTTLYMIISTAIIFIIGYAVFKKKENKIVEEL